MARCVVSFPKSGRTWLRVILDDLGVLAEYSHAGASHQEAKLPTELGTEIANEFSPILFLMRDPRDTAVSGYYQATRRLKRSYQGSMSEFIRDPRHGIEKILAFNQLWVKLSASRPDIAILTYEAMHEDGPAAVRSALSLFGEERSDSAIRYAMERNRFAEMQRREITGVFDPTYRGILGARKEASDRSDPRNLKCRNGRVGGYQNELGADDIAYCNAAMDRLGYVSLLEAQAHEVTKG